MATRYDKGDNEIQTRILAVIADHFPDLLNAKVQVKCLFATSDEPPAIRHQGYPAAAMIRINNLRDRTLGNGDALMIVDKRAYDELTSERAKDGLMHHELHHLIVKKDKESEDILRDDLGRPRLAMRKHDWSIGWFEATARIFGKDAPEVKQARQLIEYDGQVFFPFMANKSLAEMGVKKRDPKVETEDEPAEGSEKGTTDGKPARKKRAKKGDKPTQGELEVVK